MKWILEAFADEFLGDGVFYSAIGLAVAVDVAFVVSVVVLDASSSGALELDLDVSSNCFETPCLCVFLLDIEAFAFDFGNEFGEVVGMILEVFMSPDEVGLDGFALVFDGGLDEDVLEDPLWSDGNRRYA